MVTDGRVRSKGAAPGGHLQVAVTSVSSILWAIYQNTFISCA